MRQHIYLILIIGICSSSKSNKDNDENNHNKKNNIGFNIPDPECTGIFNLCTEADKERLGRQAVKSIHEQMDDDKDGLIEASESRDFIHEELESKTDSARYRRFQKADLQITFDDLWEQWRNNPVYNWSNDDVIYWLVNSVHLSMYAEYFRRNQIDGRMMPRLATNDKHYLSAVMQIRDPRHKRRLIIKATDVVLFGPPQRTHNYVKDAVLISALLVSIGACLYAFIRHRKTRESMNMMLRELETLQKAECDLVAVSGKMKLMENELQDKTKIDRGLLDAWFQEVRRTKEEAEKYRKLRGTTVDNDKKLRLAINEIEQLRIALRKAEEHVRHQSYEAPSELVDLLKRTYHTEEMGFETKRKSAESAMLVAKDQMNKISRMQRGFFGAVRIAHTGCMDNISELINTAKERLAEVHDEYEEREQRWHNIASLLNRDDLVGTTSMNNDSISRARPSSVESSSLVASSIDSSPTNKVNSTRALTTASQQDMLDPVGNGLEQSSLLSTTIKGRLVMQSRSGTERLVNSSSMVYSNSSNSINDLYHSSTVYNRPTTFELMEDNVSAKQTQSSFENISDSQLPSYEARSDDQQFQLDNHTRLINASIDDGQLSSSLGRKSKTAIPTKLLKPFQNIRFRRKT